MPISTKERYVNLFTDFGFKKIFGEDVNKELLIDFLNELLRDEQGQITSLTYLKNEHLGNTSLDRKTIFDLYCENERGEKFIVEIQKTKQKHFKDRTMYYATFPIQEQAQRGDWNYELTAVYTIAILDFEFDEDKHEPDKFKYTIKLSDIETQRVFYDKLTFIYLEMPKFRKTLDQLDTHFEKWLYVIRNLERLEKIPDSLKEHIFIKLFESAEIAKFTPTQLQEYEDSLKVYRDLKNSIDTAIEEGIEIGKEQGIEIGKEQGIEIGKEQGIEIGKEQGIEIGKEQGIEIGKEQGIAIGEKNTLRQIAMRMKSQGATLDNIQEITGLTEHDISTIE